MTQPKSLAERARAVTNERHAFGAFIVKLRADNIGVLAGFVSWRILTSLTPIVVGVAALSGLLLENPGLEHAVVDKLSAALQGVLSPHDIRTIVQTATSRTGLLAIIGFVGFFWGSANVGGSISTAFQTIFGVRGRPFVMQKLIDLGMLFILTATMLLVVGGSLASAFLNNLLGASLPEAVQFLIGTSISSAAAFALFASIYSVFPNIEAAYKVGNVWRGALPAAVMFQAVSYIWPIYVRLSHFSRYSAFLFSLLVLSTWIYAFAMVLMVGAEVVAVSAIRKAQRLGKPVGPLPERPGLQHLVLRRGDRRRTRDAPGRAGREDSSETLDGAPAHSPIQWALFALLVAAVAMAAISYLFAGKGSRGTEASTRP